MPYKVNYQPFEVLEFASPTRVNLSATNDKIFQLVNDRMPPETTLEDRATAAAEIMQEVRRLILKNGVEASYWACTQARKEINDG